MTEALLFADVCEKYVVRASSEAARRYGNYGVTREDVQQELFVWLYGEGAARVRRWLESEPQKKVRTYRALVDVARSYCETEKAARLGYETSDVQWYSPALIEGLMPLVFDKTFDGSAGAGDGSGRKQKKAPQEGGDMLAYVVDIRRAISRCPDWVGSTLLDNAPGGAGWDQAVVEVLNVLGGERPTIGRRRVQSNAAAQYATKENEAP